MGAASLGWKPTRLRLCPVRLRKQEAGSGTEASGGVRCLTHRRREQNAAWLRLCPARLRKRRRQGAGSGTGAGGSVRCLTTAENRMRCGCICAQLGCENGECKERVRESRLVATSTASPTVAENRTTRDERGLEEVVKVEIQRGSVAGIFLSLRR